MKIIHTTSKHTRTSKLTYVYVPCILTKQGQPQCHISMNMVPFFVSFLSCPFFHNR